MTVAHGKTQMGAQGRVVIPAAARRELHLEPGDELIARIDGESLVLEKRDALLRRIQAEYRAAAGDRSLVDELIAERRRAAKREEEELEAWVKSERSSTRRR
jgi:AbrB family looped-hinge helix DNA binding protein